LARESFNVQVLGTGGVRRDEGEVDVGFHGGGQVDLGLLRRFLQALQGHAVVLQVDALVFFELVDEPLDDALVEILAAQVGVPLVDLTSKTPSPSSRIEISNVPPPRS
jgi:hypothetical protein